MNLPDSRIAYGMAESERNKGSPAMQPTARERDIRQGEMNIQIGPRSRRNAKANSREAVQEDDNDSKVMTDATTEPDQPQTHIEMSVEKEKQKCHHKRTKRSH